MNNDLEELMSKVCDGRASDAERAELTERLRQDPAARDEYLRYVDLHSALADEVIPSLESNIISYSVSGLESASSKVVKPVFTSGFILKLVAIVTVVLGIAFALRGPTASREKQAIQRTPTSVLFLATLVFAEDCDWSGEELREGGRLARGRQILKRGTAVIRMDGGAELVMAGPVVFALETVGGARLHRGEVVVRAEDGAEGFTLNTPAIEIVDLGTEFAVKVEATGATEVHCLDGAIECRDAKSDSGTGVLRAGAAVRFDEAAGQSRPVELNSPRFVEMVHRAQPRERRDLMRVYEGFFYEAGRYAPSGIIKGKGWAGPWRLRSPLERSRHGEPDSTTDMRIVHGKLNVAWPVPGGRLGMLEMPAGKTFRVRPMVRPIDLAEDEITYFSLMTYEPDHSNRPRTRPHEGVRLTYRSSADYWGEALSFGLGQGQRPHIQNGIGYGAKSSLRFPDEQSLLWVGKIVSRRNEEDQVSLRIYGQTDILDFAEPAEWHVATRGLRHDAKLDLVLLTSQGASPRIVDELRIGPTWRSVVPIRKMAGK